MNDLENEVFVCLELSISVIGRLCLSSRPASNRTGNTNPRVEENGDCPECSGSTRDNDINEYSA